MSNISGKNARTPARRPGRRLRRTSIFLKIECQIDSHDTMPGSMWMKMTYSCDDVRNLLKMTHDAGAGIARSRFGGHHLKFSHVFIFPVTSCFQVEKPGQCKCPRGFLHQESQGQDHSQSGCRRMVWRCAMGRSPADCWESHQLCWCKSSSFEVFCQRQR